MAKKKTTKKVQKPKSKDVTTGALGLGDAYAYAVEGLTEKQGESQEAWLGVNKVTLDPQAHVDRTKLNVKK